MILKLCARCQKPIAYGARLCPACAKAAQAAQAEGKAAANRRYDAKRDSRFHNFYNSKEWITLSRYLMQQAGYRCQCEGCTSLAAEVHHIIPLDTREGWARRLNPTNCIVVCKKCHNKAHGRFGARPRGPSEKY